MLLRKIIVISLFLQYLLLPNLASAAEPSAPKGISAELWSIYQEVALWDIDGTKRNLKWNRPVPYFIKGNSNQADSAAVNDNLYKISSNCSNIKPGYSSLEPNEGVVIQYLPSKNFKNVIPDTPSTATTTYAMYTYYVKRGLTKFDALIDDGLTDQNLRNWISHLRVTQGFGFGGYATNSDSTFFVSQRTSNGYVELSELDKQLISFYCSTLIRSWDSIQETKDYIDDLNSKEPNLYASYSNSLKVNVTNYGFELEIRPSGDLAIQNGVENIFYRVADLSGNVVKSGNIDISENVFELQTIQIDGLQSNKTYKIGISNQNKRGYGTLQEVSERTSTINGVAPGVNSNKKPQVSDASQEVIDAKEAALIALAAFDDAKSACKKFNDSDESLTEAELSALEFIMSNSKILNECNSQDSDIEVIESDIKAGGSVDDYNSMTDSINMSIEIIDATTAELQDATSMMVKLGQRFTNILEAQNLIQESLDSINLKISKYPAAFRVSLQKSNSWRIFSNFVDKLKLAKNKYEDNLEIIGELERLVDIEDTLDQTDTLDSYTVKQTEITSAYNSLLKLIPKFLCVKTNTIFNTGKSGKCSVGFKKILAV